MKPRLYYISQLVIDEARAGDAEAARQRLNVLYARSLNGGVEMSRDPIVEEVRRARQSKAAKPGFDAKAILAAAQKRQRRSGRKVVSCLRKPRRLNA
ncbi:MAG TPA: hypothetical protein VGF59_34395 [Bryobacteraceae bacterium]